MMRPKLVKWAVAVLASIFFLGGVTASIGTWNLKLGPEDAEAIIGRPATPVSGAGVARRTVRRTAYY
jgi:hypothetical protein